MISKTGQANRVVSGMRPTGRLHLGHYHGVLKNWLKLQHEYDCYFFVADWHALTTHYEEDSDSISESVWQMVIDWLAVGVDPSRATLFIQSRVPEHSKDLTTHGFLGYPVLQAADILLYHAQYVPVGEDQVPHIELTREIARRFNYLYGREPGFEEKAEDAIKKLGKRGAKLYRNLRNAYTERGDHEALEKAHALLANNQNLSNAENERLFGYLEGGGRAILSEPESKLTEASKLPGLDGEKMSKSYRNTIALRDNPVRVEKAIRAMTTDPARVRRNDPGDPNRCPVWQFHHVYSDDSTKTWAEEGCRTAGIGCIDCKQPLIDSIIKEQAEVAERAKPYEEDPTLVKSIIADGCEKARETADETMEQVRASMNLDYY